MIIWDEQKNQKLIQERGISFEVIEEIILEKHYIAIMENPNRKAQSVFILRIKNYTYIVPFIIDKDENIILKTAYPSRKFHKLFKEVNDEE